MLGAYCCRNTYICIRCQFHPRRDQRHLAATYHAMLGCLPAGRSSCLQYRHISYTPRAVSICTPRVHQQQQQPKPVNCTHMADFSTPNGDIIMVLVQQTHRDLLVGRSNWNTYPPCIVCRTMLFDAHLGVKPEGVRELSRAGEKLAVSLQGKS